MTNGSETATPNQQGGDAPHPDQQGKDAPADTLLQMKEMLTQILKKQEAQEQAAGTMKEQLDILSAERIAREAKKRKRVAEVSTRLDFDTPEQDELPPPPPGGQDPATLAANQAALGVAQGSKSVPVTSLSSSEDEEYIVEDKDGNSLLPLNTEQRPTRRRRSRADQRGDTPSEKEENVRLAQQHMTDELKSDLLRQLEAKFAKRDQEMKEVRSQVHQATSRAPEIDRMMEESTQTPFTARIDGVSLPDPSEFRLDVYEGKSCPSAHLKAFHVAMKRARLSKDELDVGKCLLFVEHLKGPALQWFTKLEPNSIDKFSDLSEAFLKQYSMFLEKGFSLEDLFNTSQSSHESLRSFLQRFKELMSGVDGITDASAQSALRKALRTGEFRKELTVNPPNTIQDALHRGNDFITLEEETSAAKQKDVRERSGRNTDARLLDDSRRSNPNSGYTHHEGPDQSGAHNYAVGSGRGRPPTWNKWTRSSGRSDESPYARHLKEYKE